MASDRAGDRTSDRAGNEGIARLIARRRLVFKAEQAAGAHAEVAAGEAREAGDRWAIALSGGGIRSATFSLGVVQAIARAAAPVTESVANATAGTGANTTTTATGANSTTAATGANTTTAATGANTTIAATGTGTTTSAPSDAPARRAFAASFLSRFDYLSTVSGGGYLGGFVASLFVPGRLFPRLKGAGPPAIDSGETLRAADAAVAALVNDPPGRISSGSSGGPRTPATFPLAWLRENGRYLSPTGAGDTAYVAGLDLRNWVAVHYVVGTVLVALFALLALLRAPLGLMEFDPLPTPAATGWTVWFSPLLWLTLAPLSLWVLPVGLAFWFTYPSKRGIAGALNWAVLGACGVDVLLAALVFIDWRSPWDPSLHPRPAPLLLAMLVVTLGLVWYLLDRWRHGAVDTVAAIRVRTTRQLVSGLQWTAVILALGLLESAGQTLYLASFDPRLHSPAAWGTSGVAAALAWIVKQLTKASPAGSAPAWWRRLPLPVLGGAVGVLIFALLACLWSYVVAWLVWDGRWPDAQGGSAAVRAVVFAAAVALAWVTGQFPGFINLSSLQSFYSARLTRAYLGASNGARISPGSDDPRLSAAEPVDGDDVQLHDFWDRENQTPTTLGPFHLINTTLNKTVDPAEQLVQRDRKGQPFAVSPVGFSVDGKFNRFHESAGGSEIQSLLSVGRWVGISGAAASTGIGRQTSLGISLLLGAANVRLGAWWESQAAGAPTQEASRWRAVFRTQAYLLDEFTAKFHGLARPWQYLTDGGHFENTGLYELLRPERRVRFAVVVDAASDPSYEFADLANLIRLARIDHKVEVEVFPGPFQNKELAALFGQPEDFRWQERARKLAPPTTVLPDVTQCAMLLRVRKPGIAEPAWIVLIKPRVLASSPADVRQYALTHPTFPQESTADQFFDEAQWESYRKLGLANAEAVFAPSVRTALQGVTGVPLT